MDLAWDDAIDSDNLKDHMLDFSENVDPLMARDLCFEGKLFALAMNQRPEHMAWSRIEQWRGPCEGQFSWIHDRFAERRVEACESLLEKAKALLDQVGASSQMHINSSIIQPCVQPTRT